MMMQVWGQLEVVMPMPPDEMRIMAHVMVQDLINQIKQATLEFDSLMNEYEATGKQINRAFEKLQELLGIVSSQYTSLFGGVSDINPALLENKNFYQQPNTNQVGHIIQTTAGHIDKWKKDEEIQLDKHLEIAGFHEYYREYRKHQTSMIHEYLAVHKIFPKSDKLNPKPI
jgi:hypothetical protein